MERLVIIVALSKLAWLVNRRRDDSSVQTERQICANPLGIDHKKRTPKRANKAVCQGTDKDNKGKEEEFVCSTGWLTV